MFTEELELTYLSLIITMKKFIQNIVPSTIWSALACDMLLSFRNEQGYKHNRGTEGIISGFSNSLYMN